MKAFFFKFIEKIIFFTKGRVAQDSLFENCSLRAKNRLERKIRLERKFA